MPYLDILLSLPLLWGMFRGFRRGFIIEVCTLMALILGVYGAATFGDMGADYLVEQFNTEAQLSTVLSFAILFIAIVILVFLFGKMLEGVVKLVALGLVNKLFGLLFGLAKFLLIVSALLYIWNGFPLTAKVIPAEWKAQSYLFEPLSELAPAVYPVLKEQDWTDKLEQQFENIKDKVNL
jgi:membrane protein required for colicin V production